jgi:CheY-like chemotaxis protein
MLVPMEIQPKVSNKTVLLVEDNETYRKAVKLAMQTVGFTVLEAENGKVGLEQAQNHKPDMIVSDVNMPVMGGLDMLKAIKQDVNLQAIPFVMITNLQEEIEESVKLGADEALLKSSLTPHQVIDVCLSHLNEVNNPAPGV